MTQPTYTEIQEILGNAKVEDLQDFRISVLRNVVVEPLQDYLRYLGLFADMNCKVNLGEFDNIVQEAVGGETELLNEQIDCVLVFANLKVLSPDLDMGFAGLTLDQIETEIQRIREFINTVADGIRRQTQAAILWQGFELPLYPALGIADGQSSNGQTAVVNSLNDFLRQQLSAFPNAYFVDINLCLARVGGKEFYDRRYWYIGKAPYSKIAIFEIARENGRFIRAQKGKNKKCLVLDCDNVLWGGIVGEDGLEGIKLDPTYPGSIYHETQQAIKRLSDRGIILALCSKNNEDDVLNVFRNHPHMVLREEDISAYEINWRDKATNLRQIAATLNIGLDSMVFVDDSEFEINLVDTVLPEVEAILFPEGKRYLFVDTLHSSDLFDTLTITEEDRKRASQYRTENERRKLQSEHADISTYLSSLGMHLEIRFADGFSIPRIAQLTQKTNQFNLTTRRYSDLDISEFIDADDAEVLSVRLGDKFGDYGIVGVCILKLMEGNAVFDTFLLSCRVIGRTVEDELIAQILQYAQRGNFRYAIGEYLPTAKNIQVKDFYKRHGFEVLDEESDRATFSFDLAQSMSCHNTVFQEIDSELVQER